ncbi:hypothetical protein [Sutterella sp.]|uniref:hypothetical protein n=1 Tax=Sutterella sp. TaxID=1981025 RepID=UPI0026DFB299|nr:hypothetical protein [Sutterella sp.]MDO5532557.1 hypothetical protein [Sutterella sp.]
MINFEKGGHVRVPDRRKLNAWLLNAVDSAPDAWWVPPDEKCYLTPPTKPVKRRQPLDDDDVPF